MSQGQTFPRLPPNWTQEHQVKSDFSMSFEFGKRVKHLKHVDFALNFGIDLVYSAVTDLLLEWFLEFTEPLLKKSIMYKEL